MAELTAAQKRQQQRKKEREEKARKDAEAKRQREEAEKDFKTDTKAATKPKDNDRELFDDIASVGSRAGSLGKSALKAVVNEDAWSDLKPGGKKADWKDYGNAALDLSMLIPGAGLAGMGARAAIKGGARALATKPLQGSNSGSLAARLLANKTSDTAIRQQVKAGLKLKPSKPEAAQLRGLSAAAPLGKGAGKSTDDAAGVIGRLTGQKGATASTAVRPGGRAGAANRSVGLAQTRRSVLVKGGLAVGANAGKSIYDKVRQGPGGGEPGPNGAPDGTDAMPYYEIGGIPYPLAVDAGGNLELPAAARNALADYYDNGGNPDGTQVVFMSRG